jgi:DNA-binding LacI/PurR family transcriptional regulator
MVTISDVAAHAGVGAGTVSRVLNDSPRVSPATRARVLAAIELLEYRPNPLARGLSRGRCQTLGVIVPFFTQASAVERLRGVVAALAGSRYDLMLLNVESPLHRDEHLAALTRERADGLLVMSLPTPPEHLQRLHAAGISIVLIDVRADGLPSVMTDDVEGGRIATRHLVALGHRHIAFIGENPDNELGFSSSALRLQGYREILADAGIPFRKSYVRHGPHQRSVARRLTEQLLAQKVPPTAVFAASDVQATGVVEAVRAAGRRVPDDLSVVGYDDIEISGYAGITTVRQALFDSGRLGAELLLSILQGDVPMTDDVRSMPLELVERSTTAPPRPRRTGDGRG